MHQSNFLRQINNISYNSIKLYYNMFYKERFDWLTLNKTWLKSLFSLNLNWESWTQTICFLGVYIKY